jgi:hypothetical protein
MAMIAMTTKSSIKVNALLFAGGRTEKVWRC